MKNQNPKPYTQDIVGDRRHDDERSYHQTLLGAPEEVNPKTCALREVSGLHVMNLPKDATWNACDGNGETDSRKDRNPPPQSASVSKDPEPERADDPKDNRYDRDILQGVVLVIHEHSEQSSECVSE